MVDQAVNEFVEFYLLVVVKGSYTEAGISEV